MSQSRIVFTDESVEFIKERIDAMILVMSTFRDYNGGGIEVTPEFQAICVRFFRSVLPKLTIEFQRSSGLSGVMHSAGFKEDIDRQIKEMADSGEKPESAWDVVPCFIKYQFTI